MRLVTAYARNFVKPEPYRLKRLAEAANMSISGARTMYEDGEIVAVEERLNRRHPKEPQQIEQDDPLLKETKSVKSAWLTATQRREVPDGSFIS
ncbi:hypothetical protein [Planotetraspora silvatica]|nr:hypothetical protein [Planotetraspora silvatica]